MRRKDREVKTFEEIMEMIHQGEVCRIAIHDEFPYIVPLNYGVLEENGKVTLYFHSANAGRKVDLLRKNPKVGFEIDYGHELKYDDVKSSCTMLYSSVMGHGTVQFVDGDEKIAGLRRILSHYGREEGFTLAPALVERTLVFKIECEDLTGKKH